MSLQASPTVSKAPSMERSLRWACALVAAGLVLETAAAFFTHSAGSFLLLALSGGGLALTGLGLYFYSLLR